MQVASFSQPHYVSGRASIADLFRASRRCGVYILHFANGEIYVGQAEDVTRRYAQHRKTYRDIEKLSFKRVAKRNLDEEERSTIWLLEREGYHLRNITFASVPKGDSDFDLVMPVEEQERWLTNLNYADYRGSRVVNPELRRRYRAKFLRMLSMPHSARAIDLLHSYVNIGIPAVLRGEISFWACS